MSEQRISLSFSPHFMNKENRAPLKPGKDGSAPNNRYAHGAFTTVNVTAEAVVKHITSGKAISVAALKDNWRKEANFISAQLMGVDFDESPGVDALLEDWFVKAYAFLVYPTPSHTDEKPRSRVLFCLDAPITNAEDYKRLIKRLMQHFSAPVDESCKDVVRVFYGSDKRGYHADTSKRLSLPVLEALPPHPDELKPLPEQRQATALTDLETRGRAEKYALAAKQNILTDALHTPAGAGQRHQAFNAAVCKAIAKAKGNWPGFENIEADLRYLGLEMGRDEDEIARSIKGAWSEVDAEPLTLETRPPQAAANPAVSAAPSNGQTPAPASETAPAPIVWRTSADGMARFKERLSKGRGNNKLPLIFPFKSVHEFGGLAHVLDRGYLVGIVGMSGGTKTSFVECLTEPLRQMGVHGLWWGVEWTWEKMADRAVQRNGGASVTEMLLHEMWLDEESMGIAPSARNGVRLPDYLITKSGTVADTISGWGGQNHQLDGMITDVDTLLTESGKRIDDLHTQGVEVAYAVFDYMQLLDLYSAKTEADRLNTINGKIKEFCVKYQLIGFVVSQVTKGNATNAKTGAAVLEAESGQFMRSDKFNLVLTLNPIYAGGLLTTQGKLNVAKNSLGKTGVVWLYIDPAKFQWLDKVVPDAHRIQIDENGGLVF